MKHFENWLHHIVSVLPAVYDNTLSYYEILSKIISALKEEAEKLEAMGENVEEINTAISTIESTLNTLSATVENVENTVERHEEIIHDISSGFYVNDVFDGDLNTLAENSVRNFSGSATNKPAGVTYGMVLTFFPPTPSTSRLLTQIAIDNLNNKIFIRHGSKVGDSIIYFDWNPTETFKNFKEIFSGNLDELKTTGTYHINGTASHIPVTNLGGLCYVNDFTNTTGETTTTQIYITATVEPEMYFRTTGNTGVFATWHKVNDVNIDGKMDKPTSTYFNHFGAVGVNGGVDWRVDFTTLNVNRSMIMHSEHMADCVYNGFEILPANNNAVEYPDISVKTNGGIAFSTIRYVGSTAVCGKIFVENTTGKSWILKNAAPTVRQPEWVEISNPENFDKINNEIINLAGSKNLFNPFDLQESYGLSFTVENDGSVSVYGTTTRQGAYSNAFFSENSLPYGLKPGDSITFSCNDSTQTVGISYGFNSGSWGQQFYVYNASQTITIPANAVGMNIRIATNKSSGFLVDKNIKPMIKISGYGDTTFTPYSPTTFELYRLMKQNGVL